MDRMAVRGAASARPVGRFVASVLALGVVALFSGAGAASAVKRRAFVTSEKGNGNLSTWTSASGATAFERADAICRAAAQNASGGPLPNAATYRAWISTSTTDAYCHVQGLSGTRANGCNGAGSLPGGGPWFLSNGATNWSGTLDELVDDGEIYRPMSRDEDFHALATDVESRHYWTGTDEAGVATDFTCSGWTSSASSGASGTSGDGYATAGRWSEAIGQGCDEDHPLLCVEPGAGEVSTLRWSPGALVFVTSKAGPSKFQDWAESDGLSGIAGATRICRNLATAAHVPDPSSFVPWLSTSTVDAVSRLTTNGPFKRLDAYTVGGNLADLVDWSIDTSIHVSEAWIYLTGSGEVWTATAGNGQDTGLNCSDWSSNSTGANATVGGFTWAGIEDWTDNYDPNCAAQRRFYCFSNRITIFWDGFDRTGDRSRWSASVP